MYYCSVQRTKKNPSMNTPMHWLCDTRNLCACVCDVNICFLSHDMWCNCDQFYVDIIVILYRHPLLHCTRSPIDWNVTSRGV